MKTIIQLLIVALVLNACARGGMASWKYYNFKDAVAQEVRFATVQTPAALRQRILELAEEHEVELEPADLEVHKEGVSTVVSAAYVDYIELVPTLYTREHLFELEVNVNPVRPLTPEDIK